MLPTRFRQPGASARRESGPETADRRGHRDRSRPKKPARRRCDNSFAGRWCCKAAPSRPLRPTRRHSGRSSAPASTGRNVVVIEEVGGVFVLEQAARPRGVRVRRRWYDGGLRKCQVAGDTAPTTTEPLPARGPVRGVGNEGEVVSRWGPFGGRQAAAVLRLSTDFRGSVEHPAASARARTPIGRQKSRGLTCRSYWPPVWSSFRCRRY